MYGTKKAPMRRHDKKRKYSPVGLLDTAGSRGRLASGLGGQLLAGRLASGGFTGGLSAEKRKHGSGAKHTAEKLQQESGQYLGAFRSNTDKTAFSPQLVLQRPNTSVHDGQAVGKMIKEKDGLYTTTRRSKQQIKYRARCHQHRNDRAGAVKEKRRQ